MYTICGHFFKEDGCYYLMKIDSGSGHGLDDICSHRATSNAKITVLASVIVLKSQARLKSHAS